MSKILWINPVGTDAYNEMIKDGLIGVKQPQTDLDVVSLDKGPTHLEHRYYEILVLKGQIFQAVWKLGQK